MACVPTEVDLESVVEGNGPPCTIAPETSTPVGKPFNKIRPTFWVKASIKSPDFFNVEKYPTGKFVFNQAKNLKVGGESVLVGQLTIKDKMGAVQLPVTIEKNGEKYTGSGKVSIDRTRWDLV